MLNIYEGGWHMILFVIFSINGFLTICWCAARSLAKALFVREFLGTLVSPTNHPVTISKMELTSLTDFRPVRSM